MAPCKHPASQEDLAAAKEAYYNKYIRTSFNRAYHGKAIAKAKAKKKRRNK